MQVLSLKKYLAAAIIACTVGYAGISNAHTAGATLDFDGTVRNFTGMAFVTCNDDGNGPADNIIVRIRDNSPPVPGLLVNLQVYKGNKANSITDTISGDANFSPFITLHGGAGVYWLLVNKTDIGARTFEVEYHCNTADDVHTGTDIGVTQFGVPSE
jgi:hypothetical protein